MVSTILTTTVHKISSYHQMSCRSMHTSATVNAQPTRFNDLEFWFWVDAPKLSLLTVFSKREMLIDIVSQAAYRQETCPLFAEYVPGVVWDRRAKCLTAVLQYSPAVFPSLRSVTPHLTSRWDGLFLIWHPERKHYTSAGADTRSAEKRRADNQIVRFGDTPCDLFGAVSDERWPRSKMVVLHWHNRFNDGRRHCRPTKDRLRWNCDTWSGLGSTISQCDNLTSNNFSPTNRNAGGNDAMIKVIDRHIMYTFFFIHVVTVGVRNCQ